MDRAQLSEYQRQMRRAQAYGRWQPRTGSIGAQRRLQGLAWLGWDGALIASRLGVSRQAVYKLRAGLTSSTQAATSRKLDAVFRELCSRPRPVGKQAERARKLARTNGWLSPWVWDDIDDPHELPKGLLDESA